MGGEWGGSVLLAMEWAQTNKHRGFITSWPQFGAPAGLFLANSAVLFFSWYSGDQFLVWGWRIPFFISIVMVAVGLWIRLGILETPVFQNIFDGRTIERVPVLEVLKRQPKQVVLSALVRMPEQAPGLFSARSSLPMARGCSGKPVISCCGALSRRRPRISLGHLRRVPVGRGRPENMYMFGCVLMGIFGFVYFAMLDTMNPTIIFIAVAISLIPVMTLWSRGGTDRRIVLAAPAL